MVTFLKSYFYVLLFILVICLLSFRPILDPDLGWHIATGRLVWQQKQVPRIEPFAFSTPNNFYVAHAWLQDLMIFSLESFMKLWGVTLWYLVMLVVISLVAATHLFRVTRKAISLLTLLPAFSFMVSFIGLRTHLVTILGLSVIHLYFCLSDTPPKSGLGKALVEKSRYFLVLFFILWANMHAGVIVGIFFYFTHLIVTTASNKSLKLKKYNFLKSRFILGCLLALAVLVNPYGLKLYSFVLNIGPTQTSAHYNQDWVWLFSSLLPQETVIPRLSLVALSVLTLVFSKHKQTKLLVGFWSLLSVWSIRFTLPLFVVLLPELGILAWRYLGYQFKSYKAKGFTLVTTTVAIVFFSIPTITNTWCVNTSESCYASFAGFPYDAVKMLETISSQKNILNYYDWGGYLVWKLPNHKIFIDGRMDNYHRDNHLLIEDFAAIEQNNARGQQVLETYQPTAILLPSQWLMVSWLKESGNWQVLSENEVATLLVQDQK